jgi:transcriptional regulator with XRE-family HTH domain
MTPRKGRKPIRTASPTLRKIFEIMADRQLTISEMARMIGKHENNVSLYRRGRAEPGIFVVEGMAAALGLELQITEGKRDV